MINRRQSNSPNISFEGPQLPRRREGAKLIRKNLYRFFSRRISENLGGSLDQMDMQTFAVRCSLNSPAVNTNRKSHMGQVPSTQARLCMSAFKVDAVLG